MKSEHTVINGQAMKDTFSKIMLSETDNITFRQTITNF